MKATTYGFLAAVVALVLFATPLKVLAHDFGGWHHDHGHHWGWYKHHGGEGWGGYGPGYGWHHHDCDDDDWGEHGGYGGYGPYGGYGAGYGGYGPGYGVTPPISIPWNAGGYQGYYGSGYAPNGKLMRMQQRYNANQALYQAAMAQGNYPLANKAAAHMQKQSMRLNAANSMLGGMGIPYGAPGYGANPYYGQGGYSPLSSIMQMFVP